MENTIVLTDAERIELNQRAASRSGRADDARRARTLLLLEAGYTWAAIRDKLDCNDAFIDRWSKRFREERLAGLFSRHAGQEASTLTPALEARILEWTLKHTPPDGATQWSTRRLGTQLQVSHMMVARVWAKHGLKPQRLDRYMASNDPDFEQKAADIIGFARHTSAEFVAFLADIVVNQPRGKEIHVIADNLSAHKTGQVDDFLDRHPKVHLHFTPTYSSWLNQIELWFAKIERDVIARGVFTSLADLRRKLMKYIRHYNKVPKTVKWRYFDPTRRITLNSAVTGH
jgi:transposase